MRRVSALRRIRAEGLVTSAAALAVALALVLLASGPIFADAVSTGALRRSLSDAPTADSGIVVDARLWLDELDAADELVRRGVATTFRDADATVVQSMEASVSYALPEQPREDRTDLARISWAEQVEQHVAVTAGRWPDAPREGAPIEVVIDETAADVLGLGLGTTVPLVARTGSAEPVDVVVVGLLRPDDPFSSFWHGRERLVEPVTVTSTFRTVNLLATREAALGPPGTRVETEWLVLPDFGGLELDEVDALRRRVVDLEDRVNGGLFEPDADPPAEVSVRTGLPDLLVGGNRSLTVARAVIFATVTQLAVLAGFALTLVAGLGVDARRAESTLMRARGAGPGQLTRQALVDATLIVAPLTILAPLVATWVVGWFDEFGPLASIDLELTPRPVAAAWWTAGAAAVVTVVLLVLPAARAALAAAAEGATPRARVTGPIQRSGLDLAVLGAAAFAYWQLRVLGDDRAADLQGRFGVDPLVVLAPMFGIVAGGLLVLRVLPMLAGSAERLVRRRRGAVGALTVWQLSRRPQRYSRTTLLVTLAVAVGIFAAVYEPTWTGSQRAQAAHEVAADVRVEPNRRVGDSVGALQLTSLLSSLPEVETVMATVELTTTLPGEGPDGRLLALDVGAIGAFNDEADAATVGALAALHARRPDIPGLDLPGTPTELVIPVEIVEVDRFGQPLIADPDQPERPPVAGSIALTVQDGDGLLHEVSAGALTFGPSQRSIVLSAPDVGPAAVPRPPLRIVDIQLDTVTQWALSRFIEVTLGPIDVVDDDGSVASVPLAGVPFALESETLGFLATPASATVASTEAGSMRITATSGSSVFAVRVVHTVTRTLLPDGRLLAGLVDRQWADGAEISVGDVIDVPTDRVDGVRVEVVGLVDVVPGIDPGTTPAVLVDLPSMLWHERAPGRVGRNVTEYWLGLEPGATVAVETFSRPPVEAVAVTVLEDRRTELTANPPALGSLGALGAGFLASVILAVAALVLTAVVSVRERAAEFAVLEALGLRRSQQRAWLFREQVVIVVFGVVVGAGIGLGLAALMLPVTSLAQDGGSTFPAVEVVIPWAPVLGLALGVGAASLVAVGVALGLRARGSAGSTLRTGVER